MRAFSRQFCYFTNTPKPHQLPKRSISSDAIEELHARLIRMENQTDPCSVSEVLRSYTLSSSTLQRAEVVFNEIRRPPLLLWNFMIQGFSHFGDPIKAVYFYNSLLRRGLKGNHVTCIFVFKACGRALDSVNGRTIHAHVVKLGFELYLYVCNALVHMYALCGELGLAQKVFDQMTERDLVTWNSLICGYSQHSRFKEVLRLFGLMGAAEVEADEITMMKVILACSNLAEWELADSMVKNIEEKRVETNVYLGNTLIDMYGRRGLVDLAQRTFDRMQEKNLVSWNALIIGQAKSGNLGRARELFDEMPKRDVVSWTSMITGYSQAGQFQEAVKLFHEMIETNIKPDEKTVATVLSACAHLGILDVGEAVHDLVNKHHITSDIHVGNALIDMYCKCGVVERAMKVFQDMKEKDSVSWASIISGLAVNGFAASSLELFEQMLRENVGPRPTHGTFVGILVACAHVGLVDKGLEYFVSMEKVHGLVPQMKHYGCVVDLLCRSGKLDRAYQFIRTMPMPADAVLWRILLGACKLHGDVVLAEIALNNLHESDPNNSVNYVLLSNTYAGAERWDAATRLRDMMKEGDVQKPLGWSSL
ncbi:hypothetical protein Dimus_000345 [Dionaea muscipula]